MFPAWFVCLFLCVEFSLGSLSDEFDASIDEVQSLMQTSKGESSIDVSADFRESTTSEDLAADALFLIETTFGPSSTSLDKLQRMTHQEWVAEQMSLPVVSTFTLDDEGRRVEVDADHNIYVDGAFRSAPQPGGMVSRWSFVSNFTGCLCSMFEGVGQTLAFGSTATCTDTVMKLPNPAVWSPDVVQTAFDLRVLPNGVVVLNDEADPCHVEKSTVISQGHAFYRFDNRLQFAENTLENPDPDVCAAPPSPFNTDSCKVVENRNRTAVNGLTVNLSGSQSWVDSDSTIV